MKLNLNFVKDEEIKDKILSICTLAKLTGGEITFKSEKMYKPNEKIYHLMIIETELSLIHITFHTINKQLSKSFLRVYDNGKSLPINHDHSPIEMLNQAQKDIFLKKQN